MKKLFTVLLLVAAFSLLLAGCGKEAPLSARAREDVYSGETLYMYSEYSYAEDGSWAKKECFHASGQATETYLWEFDEAGQLLRMTCSYGEDPFYYDEYTQDAAGNIVTATRHYANGDFCYRMEYRYDENGVLVEKLKYLADDKLEFTVAYTYDDKGHISMTTNTLADGTISQTQLYVFEDGVENITVMKDGAMMTALVNNTYDEDGNLLIHADLTITGKENLRTEYTLAEETLFDHYTLPYTLE